MAGTINYTYDPEQVVWVISTQEGGVLAVRQGVVHSVRGLVLNVTGPEPTEYNITLDGEKTARFYAELDTFVDLTSAVAEYEARLSV